MQRFLFTVLTHVETDKTEILFEWIQRTGLTLSVAGNYRYF